MIFAQQREPANNHQSLVFKVALRQELIDKNPLVKLKRVKVVPSSPQGLSRQQVGKILKIIPKDELRDRLLFGLLFETGLRILVSSINMTKNGDGVSLKH